MYERFTDRARKVMQLANQEAQRFNHEYIGTEHILLGLVKEGSGVAANVLKNLDIDLPKVRQEVESIVQAGPEMVTQGKLPQTPRAKKVIEFAIEEAKNLNHNYIGTEHVLLGLLREEEGVAAQVLINLGTGLNDVREEILNMLGRSSGQREAATGPAGAAKTKTPALNSFGRDLTDLARQGKLDPCVGRAAELGLLLRVLSCRVRSNPLLVGGLGVGKTALVEGLAQQIAAGAVPPDFVDRRIVTLDMGQMLLGTHYQWEKFYERVQAVLNEVQRTKNVLLFLDGRLHPLASPWHAEAIDYANFSLLAAVARGNVQCIGAVTPNKYHDYCSRNAVVTRCFEPIEVRPPSRQEAVEMLRGLRDRFEAHHRVTIQDDALEAAVELCLGTAGGTCLPGRAVALLDQAAAGVRLQAALAAPDLRDLDTELERLIQDKEAAVSGGDFEKAAALRDQADKLKKRREQTVRQWREQTHASESAVDRAAVAAAAHRLDPTPPF